MKKSSKKEQQESQLHKTVRFNHFDFSFEMVLDEPDARSVFKVFCDEVLHTGESLNFIEAVEKFKVLRHVKSRNKLSQSIIDAYIRINSPQEVNISGEVRGKIIERYEAVASKDTKSAKKGSLAVVPVDIFDEAFMWIISELKHEVFPRFTRSAHLRKFVKVIEQTDPEMLHRIAQISKPSGKSLYNIFDSEDAKRSIISEKDIERLESLSEDLPHKWKVTRDHENYQVFSSVCRYALHNKEIEDVLKAKDEEEEEEEESEEQEAEANRKKSLGRIVHKVSGMLNYSMKCVINTVTNPVYKDSIDNSLIKSYQMDYIVPSEEDKDLMCTSVTLDSLPLPWPIACRDFVSANSMVRRVREDQEKYFIVKRSYEHSKLPERTGTVRSEIFSGWILEKLKDNVTKYSFVEYSDMKFNELTSKYYSKVTKRRFEDIHEALVEALAENARSGFPAPEHSFGLLETFSKEKDEGKLAALRNAESSAEQEQGRVKRIAYLSKYSKPFSNEELVKIGAVSVKNNQPRNITGMLLCGGGVFYQVVEGLPEDVDFIYAKIIKDERHNCIKLVSEEYNLKDSERQFPNWSMNTVNLDTCEDYFSLFMKNMIKLISELDSDNTQDKEHVAEKLLSNATQLLKRDHLSSAATKTIAATLGKKHRGACSIL